MSKDKLTDYSATAASNTDIGGVNIDEGMLPSGVNNALREQMSHLADFAAGTTGIDVLNLQDDDASHSIKIQAPASVTTTTTFTLPDGDGSANQSLVTNGSGTLSFSTRLANVVEDTTPQLGGNLDTNGNDITFGYNDKAIFGAGSDLQILHDGTHSYISEVGTGDLRISGATNVDIRDNAGYKTFRGVSRGEAILYYDNAQKLATTSTGVDVQGSVTADGLTVDGDSDLTHTTPSNGSTMLTLRDNRTTTSEENYILAINRQNSTTPAIYLGNNDSNNAIIAGNNTATLIGYDVSGTFTSSAKFNNNGDISFYDSTGTTQGLFWDADQQRLGLGTTTPSQAMHIYSSGTDARLRIEAAGTNGEATLELVNDASAFTVRIDDDDSFRIRDTDGSGERDRLVIDGSGNLLVGKTADNFGVAGHQLWNTGVAYHTRDGSHSIALNRLTSDGDIAKFYKDGTTVGSIGAFSSDLTIGDADVAIRFDTGTGLVPWNISTNVSTNGAIDIGASSARFKDLYLSGGVYLGGTGSANYLDDYEEGTWDIEVREGSGGTDAVVSNVLNFAKYTKIGNLVHVYWRVNVSSSSSSTLHIAGLPFYSTENYFQVGGGMQHGTQGHSFFAQNGGEFKGYRIATGEGADTSDASGVYRGSFQYEAT